MTHARAAIREISPSTLKMAFNHACCLLAFALSAVSVSMCIASEPPQIQILEAGGILDSGEVGDREALQSSVRGWYAVSIKGATLVLDPVTELKQSGWKVTLNFPVESTADGTPKMQSNEVIGTTLATPDAALFAFKVTDRNNDYTQPPKGPITWPRRSVASLLPSAVVLKDKWTTKFRFRGAEWKIFSTMERRKDGAVLAGSLALFAEDSSGKTQVLMPPAHGMALRKQELLWVGSLGNNDVIDMVVKRTAVTGEIDYVLRAAGVLGITRVDEDYPYELFSSGAENSDSVRVHARQRRAIPKLASEQVAVSVDQETWNALLTAAMNEALPRKLFERHLAFEGEKMAVTFDYLPRAIADGAVASSSSHFWEGPVLVNVHYRGHSQTLLEVGGLDEGDFELKVLSENSSTLIQVIHWPHYNNVFTYYFIWDRKKNRFMRLSRYQSQGC